MKNVGLVDQQAAGRSRRCDLVLEQLAEWHRPRRERQLAGELQRHQLGRRIFGGHVGEQHEGRHLRVLPIGARHHQAVIAKVAMMKLIVVDGSGVLCPQLDLVNFQVLSAEQPLRAVDQIGV